jgi:coproporphyrinogen III oxidase-like Fe-S oxidoreductase
LDQLADFPLRHLSAYELIVEEGTPFYDRYLEGRLPLPEVPEV